MLSTCIDRPLHTNWACRIYFGVLISFGKNIQIPYLTYYFTSIDADTNELQLFNHNSCFTLTSRAVRLTWVALEAPCRLNCTLVDSRKRYTFEGLYSVTNLTQFKTLIECSIRCTIFKFENAQKNAINITATRV